MEADHAETSAAGAKRHAQRLTLDGRKLLKDFAEQVTAYPDLHQKQQLLDELRLLPGCGHAHPKTVQKWFGRHRMATRKKLVPDDDNLLFPNLAQSQLQVLRTLLHNNPVPAKDMIDIWATCIQAELEDVKMWVSYQLAKVVPQDVSEHSMSVSPTTPHLHPHLPTPATSLSPRVREMSLPLIATKKESSPPGSPLSQAWPTHVSHTSSLHHVTECADEVDEIRPQFTHIPSPEKSRSLCDIPVAPSPAMQLAKETNYFMKAHHPTPHLPTTHAEFDAMFKPYEEMMTRFIHNVESGKLQHLGWAPSLSKAASTSLHQRKL